MEEMEEDLMGDHRLIHLKTEDNHPVTTQTTPTNNKYNNNSNNNNHKIIMVITSNTVGTIMGIDLDLIDNFCMIF
jgi:hypothetical protein